MTYDIRLMIYNYDGNSYKDKQMKRKNRKIDYLNINCWNIAEASTM